ATDAHADGTYTFIVDKKATKAQIRQVIEYFYKVNVEKVRTAIMPGKPKTRYSKARISSGHTKAYKKAYVKLQAGEYIDLYEEDEA
ncbi:MAG: 50S ribosomal protein L23, partial [Bernardetiaceae bacterium]